MNTPEICFISTLALILGWAIYYYIFAFKYAQTVHAESVSYRAQDKAKCCFTKYIQNAHYDVKFIQTHTATNKNDNLQVRILRSNCPTYKLKLYKLRAFISVLIAPAWFYPDVETDILDPTEEEIQAYEKEHPEYDVVCQWRTF
jgi:hypothetical protein